jgi:hypothetical protein
MMSALDLMDNLTVAMLVDEAQKDMLKRKCSKDRLVGRVEPLYKHPVDKHT